MKRLRKKFPERKIRYYMCGEYGEETSRPHFHACLFNFDFNDKIVLSKNSDGRPRLWRSQCLDQLWPYGHGAIGAVTFETAAYVARYVMKKITGDKAQQHYQHIDPATGEITNRTPEYNKMSLKPGIGKAWITKWQQDVYPHGKVIINGKEANPPRYYDKHFKKIAPYEYEELVMQREIEGRARYQDNTPERLAVKETVARARANLTRRKH